MIIPRERLISIIDKTLERYPVVLLIGPRQCGKTTIALEIRQRKKGSYFDLEDPDTPLQAEVAKITLKDIKGCFKNWTNKFLLFSSSCCPA